MVVFYQAKYIGIVALHEIHNAFFGAIFGNVFKFELGVFNEGAHIVFARLVGFPLGGFSTFSTFNLSELNASISSFSATTSSGDSSDEKSVASVITGLTEDLVPNGITKTGTLVFDTMLLALLPNKPLIPVAPMLPITSNSTGLASI